MKASVRQPMKSSGLCTIVFTHTYSKFSYVDTHTMYSVYLLYNTTPDFKNIFDRNTIRLNSSFSYCVSLLIYFIAQTTRIIDTTIEQVTFCSILRGRYNLSQHKTDIGYRNRLNKKK